MSKRPIARKRFGQNFLHDGHIIEQIVGAINPQLTDKLVEIGPGLGALTNKVLAANCALIAIEIDRDLGAKLTEQFKLNSHFQLYQADALTFDFTQLTSGISSQKMRVFGNLPYNISTPLQFYLFKFCNIIKDMHFMLQKEVVDRMAATPGTKDYGRLSVMIQYHCQVTPLFGIPPTAFHPQPKVQSTLVRLTPFEHKKYHVKDYSIFSDIVRLAFNQRRKTIFNALKTMISPDQWQVIDIEPTARAEQLSINQFIKLSDLLSKH